MTKTDNLHPYEELASRIVKKLITDCFMCGSFECERGNPTGLSGLKRIPASPFTEKILQKNLKFFCKEDKD